MTLVAKIWPWGLQTHVCELSGHQKVKISMPSLPRNRKNISWIFILLYFTNTSAHMILFRRYSLNILLKYLQHFNIYLCSVKALEPGRWSLAGSTIHAETCRAIKSLEALWQCCWIGCQIFHNSCHAQADPRMSEHTIRASQSVACS